MIPGSLLGQICKVMSAVYVAAKPLAAPAIPQAKFSGELWRWSPGVDKREELPALCTLPYDTVLRLWGLEKGVGVFCKHVVLLAAASGLPWAPRRIYKVSGRVDNR